MTKHKILLLNMTYLHKFSNEEFFLFLGKLYLAMKWLFLVL